MYSFSILLKGIWMSGQNYIKSIRTSTHPWQSWNGEDQGLISSVDTFQNWLLALCSEAFLSTCKGQELKCIDPLVEPWKILMARVIAWVSNESLAKSSSLQWFIGHWICSPLFVLTFWIAEEISKDVRCPRQNKELVTMVRLLIIDNSVPFIFSSITGDSWGTHWENRIIYYGGQQSVFTVDLFISDYSFTASHPGVTLTCRSQPHTRLQKFRFIFDCKSTYSWKSHHLPGPTFPVQSCTHPGSPFLYLFTLSRYQKPWVCFPS